MLVGSGFDPQRMRNIEISEAESEAEQRAVVDRVDGVPQSVVAYAVVADCNVPETSEKFRSERTVYACCRAAVYE